MFDLLLFNLRAQGVKVGLGEWMAFLEGLQKGMVVDPRGLYGFGRAVLCQTEAQYDAWDLAFQATFQGVELPDNLRQKLEQWLADTVRPEGEQVPVDMTPDQLREEFLKRLREQTERHDGGRHWVGTGGTSPFGQQGRAESGVSTSDGGGGRGAIRLAESRRWAGYRTDTTLEQRDFQAALKQLRALAREGPLELHVDKTIRKTSDNGGEIDLIYDRRRQNRVRLALIMDTGGSMDPHTRLVERLFSASKAAKGFKTFEAWYFHNVPTGWLYRNYATWDRQRIEEILDGWTPQHRLVFVGDASMAPWELNTQTPRTYGEQGGLSGLDWLKMIRQRCPGSVWLNPDPVRFWDHPTVSAVGAVFPMFPLTLDGLRDAIRRLRGPVG